MWYEPTTGMPSSFAAASPERPTGPGVATLDHVRARSFDLGEHLPERREAESRAPRSSVAAATSRPRRRSAPGSREAAARVVTTVKRQAPCGGLAAASLRIVPATPFVSSKVSVKTSARGSSSPVAAPKKARSISRRLAASLGVVPKRRDERGVERTGEQNGAETAAECR